MGFFYETGTEIRASLHMFEPLGEFHSAYLDLFCGQFKVYEFLVIDRTIWINIYHLDRILVVLQSCDKVAFYK